MNPNLIALIFGAGFLGLLAHIFRGSNLASIPLVGAALLVILWPLYEKLRTLIRVAAEFSPTKALVVAESSDVGRLAGQGSVQSEVQAQVQQSQYELAHAIDAMLIQNSSGVSDEVRQQVRTAIEQYSTVAQQHAANAIDLLLRRQIFEYLLRGPAYWSEVIDHLTYVFSGRTDLVAKQNTADYVNQIAVHMMQDSQIAFTTIADRAVVYLVQSEVSVPAEPPKTEVEGSNK